MKIRKTKKILKNFISNNKNKMIIYTEFYDFVYITKKDWSGIYNNNKFIIIDNKNNINIFFCKITNYIREDLYVYLKHPDYDITLPIRDIKRIRIIK